MVFAFAKALREKKVAASKQPAPRSSTGTKSPQKAKTFNRLGCKACPLDKADICTPKIKPTIPDETLVYFLGEAPGEHEDEVSGKPFTGPSERLLHQCIPDENVDYCGFENTINCRPPKNRTPEWNEIESCRPRIIAGIEKAKPRLIVGLGAIALNWAVGSMDMSGMRGRLFAIKVGSHSCWFMATYHPSFIQKIAHDKANPLRSKMGFCFRMDLEKAFKLVDYLEPPIIDTPEAAKQGIDCYPGGPGQLEQVLKHFKAVSRSKRSAIDVETNYLRPFRKDAKILTAAISYEQEGEQKDFSFAIDHPKASWTKKERDEILNELEAYATQPDTKKIGHNSPMELEWLIKYFGREVVIHDVWEDTMVQAHCIDERRGKAGHGDGEITRAAYQGLGFLTKKHFGLDIKKLFKFNKKKMETEPLDQMLIYNGVDSRYTLRLYWAQYSELKQLGSVEVYKLHVTRQPTVALMQSLGVDVSQSEVKKHQERLGGEIEKIRAEINDLKVIKQYIKDNKEFNPQSNIDVLKVFKEYLKRPEVKVEDRGRHDRTYGSPGYRKDQLNQGGDSNKLSVDKNVLDKIDHPLAKLIIDLRGKQKLKSTYVDCLEYGVGNAIHEDGKIHTNFNTTFAETNRISSDSPNMQNYDKRKNPWVRSSIVAPKNHVIVAIDYGQLEWGTTAMCTKDKVIVQSLWDEYDIHMDWAINIANRCPHVIGGKEYLHDKAAMKKYRSIAKNKMVFPVVFGASVESVAGYLGIEEDDAEYLMDEFFEVFYGLKGWQKALMKTYYDTGLVETPTGFRRSYPLTMNQVINHPIQGVAAEIVCDSMNCLSKHACETGEWHLHPHLNVHDDLSFWVPDSEQILEESIEKIYKTMITPRFGFINVPLSCEVSVGKNWFQLEEVGKFFSHKDL